MALQLNRKTAEPKELTIATGGTTTDVLTLDGFALGMIHLPAEFDGTTLTFTVAPTYGGTYVAYEDSSGAVVTLTVEASKAYAIPEGLFGAPFAKLVAGTQTGATVITVTLRG